MRPPISPLESPFLFLLGEGFVALDGLDMERVVEEDAAATEDDVSVAYVTGVLRSSLRDLPMPPAAAVVGDAITAPLPRVVVVKRENILPQSLRPAEPPLSPFGLAPVH